MHTLAANIVWDRDAVEGTGAVLLERATSNVLEHLQHIVAPGVSVRGARPRIHKEDERLLPTRQEWDHVVADTLSKLHGGTSAADSPAGIHQEPVLGSGGDATSAAVQVDFALGLFQCWHRFVPKFVACK
jgi:hypothetical protein